MSKKLRILIADDHTLVRQGIRKILEERGEWIVVAEAHDGREAVKLAVELKPDVIVLDVSMPEMNGVDAAAQITRKVPGANVLMLSMHADDGSIVRALRSGARGYLLKDSADSDLLRAVIAVSSGESFFSPAVASVMLDDYVRHLAEKGSGDRYEALSEREREIFQLVAEGKSNKRIAELLCISPTTVETHRSNILQKLDLHSTAELVLYAVRRGVIS
jgi:two-component system response regulator NreC